MGQNQPVNIRDANTRGLTGNVETPGSVTTNKEVLM